jgi:uncharacterized protein (TIGR02453 family)
MRASFQGLPKQAFQFFRDLEQNNDRDWFEQHKDDYIEFVKKPMEALVIALGAEMTKFAPDEVTTPAKALYRIYRDTRFSANKTPYKTNAGASFFRQDLGKHIAGGYYFEISANHVGIAGGVYMPEAENWRLIRNHIRENLARFNKLTSDKKLIAAVGKLQGDKLSRPPKGYPPEDPAIEWLKFKQMYYWKELPPETALQPAIVKEIASRFKLMQPVLNFFNEPLLAAKKRRAPMETGWV